MVFLQAALALIVLDPSKGKKKMSSGHLWIEGNSKEKHRNPKDSGTIHPFGSQESVVGKIKEIFLCHRFHAENTGKIPSSQTSFFFFLCVGSRTIARLMQA